jgi:hypothetical protein
MSFCRNVDFSDTERSQRPKTLGPACDVSNGAFFRVDLTE